MDIYARAQRLVKVSRRRRLNVHITGEGSPTVILSAGGGCTTLHWGRVRPVLSRTNRVFAFDRAGMGFSDPGPLPRTTSRGLADLRAPLKATGTEPPYVLVGHSMGSFDMQLFAFLHPDEVVGMVLVDPRGDRVFERFGSAAPSMLRAAQRERRQVRRNAVVAAQRPQSGSAAYEALAAPPDPQLADAVNAALRDASFAAVHLANHRLGGRQPRRRIHGRVGARAAASWNDAADRTHRRECGVDVRISAPRKVRRPRRCGKRRTKNWRGCRTVACAAMSLIAGI